MAGIESWYANNPNVKIITNLDDTYKGHIGDVIIFKSILTKTQRYELHDYFNKKWGEN